LKNYETFAIYQQKNILVLIRLKTLALQDQILNSLVSALKAPYATIETPKLLQTYKT